MNAQPNFSKHLSRAAMAGLVLAAGPLHADTLLFLDTFNRPNSTTTDGTGLNESPDGKSGSLGALTWTGTTALFTATGNIVDINSNTLRMDATGSSGADGGFAYISDHNFTDAGIKSAGTFTVSVDIASTSSSGDSRVIGFGVGSSLAELAAVSSASPTSNPADVYFIYDNIGAAQGLRVFHNGAPQTGGLVAFPTGTPSLPDTLSGTFTFTDMNAGTTLESTESRWLRAQPSGAAPTRTTSAWGAPTRTRAFSTISGSRCQARRFSSPPTPPTMPSTSCHPKI